MAAADPYSPFSYSPSQTALLLLDFQNFIIPLCPTGPFIATKAASLRNWALTQNLTIIHSIVDVHGTPPPQTKGVPRLQQMLAGIRNDSTASSEPPELVPVDSSLEFTVLKQPGVISGIKSEDCVKLLADKGIKNLVLCGLSTSGAVLRTAVQATDDGFVVSVISDACADRTAELHDVLMTSVLPSRAHIFTAEEFMREWEAREREG